MPLQRRFAAVLLAVAALTAACDLAGEGASSGSAVDASTRAADISAQSLLRNALVAAKTAYTVTSSYDASVITPSGLAQVEPGECFVGAQTPSSAAGATCEGGQGSASVSVFGQGQVFAAAAMSTSGRCFWIRDQVGATITYGSGQPCTGAAAVGATAANFPPS